MRRFCRLSSLIVLAALASFASVGCIETDDIADMPDSPDSPDADNSPGLDVADSNGASEASAPDETPAPQDPEEEPADPEQPAGPSRQQPRTSNTGDAQYFVDAGGSEEDGVDLWIETSYLAVERYGSATYVNWYAAVRNRGLTTVCETQVRARLDNGAGDPNINPPIVNSTLANLGGFVDSAAYRLDGVPVSVACIAPGERGVFYGLTETDRGFRNRDVARIEVSFDTTVVPAAVPHAFAPTLESAEFERIDESGGGRGRNHRLVGEIRNGSDADLTDLRYQVYGATNERVFRTMVSVITDSLAAGDSVSVQTPPRRTHSSRRIAGYPSFTVATAADSKDMSDMSAAVLDRRTAHRRWASDRDALSATRDRSRQGPSLP